MQKLLINGIFAFCIFCPSYSYAWNVTLGWDAVSGATGYYLKFKTPGYIYEDPDNIVNVGNVTQYTLTGLPNGTHSFIVTAYTGLVQSEPSNEVTYYAPNIKTNLPTTTSLLEGQSTSLMFAAKGNMPINFIWTKNGATITGATQTNSGDISTSHLALYASSSTSGIYKVTASNLAGSVQGSTSVSVVLKPVINQNLPSSITINEGNSASLVLKASGSMPMIVKWYKNSSEISGAQTSQSGSILTSTYTITSPVNGDIYNVKVSNTAGVVTSANTSITVIEKPKISQSLPPTTGVVPGGNLALTASATGTLPMTVKWYKGAAQITQGITSSTSGKTQRSTLALSNLTTSSAGVYKVNFINAAGSVETSTNLIVSAKPVFSTNLSANLRFNVGSPLTLSVVATSTVEAAFQWIFKDASGTEIPLSGATTTNAGSTWTSSIVIPSPQAGAIYVKATNSSGTTNSQTMELIAVLPMPRNLRIVQ